METITTNHSQRAGQNYLLQVLSSLEAVSRQLRPSFGYYNSRHVRQVASTFIVRPAKEPALCLVLSRYAESNLVLACGERTIEFPLLPRSINVPPVNFQVVNPLYLVEEHVALCLVILYGHLYHIAWRVDRFQCLYACIVVVEFGVVVRNRGYAVLNFCIVC